MIYKIAIVGEIGSGKSTAASLLLQQRIGRIIRFADPLKDMLRVLGLKDNHLYGADKEKPCPELLGVTPRQAMQTLGTEWGRNLIHPDLWTDVARRKLFIAFEDYKHFANPCYVVFDDMRFYNEYDAIKPDYVIAMNAGVEHQAKHSSEQDWRDFPINFVIENNQAPDSPSRGLACLNSSINTILSKIEST